MAMSTAAAKSPWTGAWVAVGSIAVVSAVAVVRDWGFDSWIWAVAVCVVGGVASSVAQAGRNRRIDLAVKQAREMDSRSEFEQGSPVWGAAPRETP
jgi:hypothetical protein